MRTERRFHQNVGLTKVLVFQISFCIVWIHNDSMYVRFGGIRNTKTRSKSNDYAVLREIIVSREI